MKKKLKIISFKILDIRLKPANSPRLKVTQSPRLTISFLILSLLIFSGCSDPKLENPFDPESSFNTAPMTGELALTQLTDSEVKLEWQINNTIVGNYIIKRQVNSGGYEVLTTVDKDTDNYTDTGLLTTNTYYYQLIGANGNVQTEPISNSINPAFTEIINFNIEQEDIFTSKLTWQHDCDYEEGYIIERREITARKNSSDKSKLSSCSSQNTFKNKNHSAQEKNTTIETDSRDFIQIANLAANSTEFYDEEVIPNVIYEYKILSYTSLNLSEESFFSYDNAIPAPTNLIITQDNVHTFTLEWTDNSEGEEGFSIERKIDEGSYQLIGTTAANVTTFVDDINTRDQYETLYYRITAFYQNDYSDYLENNHSIAFPAPTNLSYDHLTIMSIELNWQDNSDGEDGFMIDKKVGINAWQIEYATVVEDIETWTDNNAEINEDLQYRVYAYSSANQSDYVETGIIDNTIPVPDNLTYTLENISYPTADINLDWDYSMSGIDGFKVKKNGSLLPEVIPAGTTEWIDVGVNIGNSYSYQVLAFYQSYNSGYSNELEVSFCVDIDGNIYETVIIGDQDWMAENLKVTHYRNGDTIPNVTDNSNWANLSTGAYCYYDNDANNADTYGALYNWYAVEEDDTRGLAPEGWRVPTDDEWQTLVDYLGGSSVAGGKMKEAGTAHWNSPNTGATNESGFTGLPGGYRGSYTGYFYDLGNYGYFWSATEDSTSTAWNRILSYNNPAVSRYYFNKQGGFSVRCVRD